MFAETFVPDHVLLMPQTAGYSTQGVCSRHVRMSAPASVRRVVPLLAELTTSSHKCVGDSDNSQQSPAELMNRPRAGTIIGSRYEAPSTSFPVTLTLRAGISNTPNRLITLRSLTAGHIILPHRKCQQQTFYGEAYITISAIILLTKLHVCGVSYTNNPAEKPTLSTTSVIQHTREACRSQRNPPISNIRQVEHQSKASG
jgi:hypothetical protein